MKFRFTHGVYEIIRLTIMANKKKTKNKKKYIVKITSGQHKLIKQYSSYIQSNPGKIIKEALTMYLKQISRDFNQWEKINSSKDILTEKDKEKQLEIEF